MKTCGKIDKMFSQVLLFQKGSIGVIRMIKIITRKFTVLILAVALTAGTAGCGDKDKPKTEEPVVSEEDTDIDYSDENEDEAGDDGEDAPDEYPNPEMVYEADSIGMAVMLPVEYTNTIGSVVLTDTDVTGYGELFYAEMNYIGAHTDNYEDEISEEEAAAFGSHTVQLFGVFAITGDRSADELASVVNNETDSKIDASDLTLLASDDGFDFYECSVIDTSNYDNLDDEFRAEYDKLFELKDDLLKNATYTRPSDAVDPYDKNGIDFTTTDFDGNTVTSKELFSQHEFTLVNVWATWCGCCVGELEGLEIIHQAYVDKNCAIVGLCGDATDEASLNHAKEILESNGVTYTNIRPFGGWEGIFDTQQCWPTSFFVNRQGDIVSEPISGAMLQSYVDQFDALLEGKEAERVKRTNSYSNSEGKYRIRVISEDLQPVEGATVQFCSDENCEMGVTGSDGIAAFDDPPGVYEVHVLKVPDGYDQDTSVYRTDEQHSDMVITLERS